jgi:B12 binding domain
VLEFNENHKVFFLDLCFSSDCEADIQSSIQSFKPDVIGISIRNIDDTGGYNVQFLLEDVKNDVIDYCKKEFPGPIVIGGPAVGISGRELLDYFDLEYAIRGDGEAVMSEFVKRIETQQPLEGLRGLIIRREKTIIQDNEPFRIQDLDSLPFPKPLRYLDLVFISTGIRVNNGAPIAEEIMKYDTLCTSDNFLYPVKIEPQKICLADIHSIAKGYSFRFPNFYFYEKEHIISGWLLITGNIILKVFHSRQPV